MQNSPITNLFFTSDMTSHDFMLCIDLLHYTYSTLLKRSKMDKMYIQNTVLNLIISQIFKYNY